MMCFTGNTWSQNEKKLDFAFTVSPGMTWMNAGNTGYEGKGVNSNIDYGILVDFRLFGEENYNFSTGVKVNNIGASLVSPTYYINTSNTVIPAKRDSKYRLNYIDIPLTLRLKTNEIGYNTFYGLFGCEVGFNINAKEKYIDSYETTVMAQKEHDISNSVNLIRASLVVGFGLERSISGDTRYRVGISYHNGLTNILKNDAYAVDANNNTAIIDNATVLEGPLNTRLSFVELNLAIIL